MTGPVLVGFALALALMLVSIYEIVLGLFVWSVSVFVCLVWI